MVSTPGKGTGVDVCVQVGVGVCVEVGVEVLVGVGVNVLVGVDVGVGVAVKMRLAIGSGRYLHEIDKPTNRGNSSLIFFMAVPIIIEKLDEF